MKNLYDWSKESAALKAIVKILEGKVSKITEIEFEALIDYFWLQWAVRENMSPCGHLTLKGKIEYLEDNIDVMKELIAEGT